MKSTSGRPTMKRSQSGVVLAECAIILPVVFLLLFGMLDLGIATLRYNSLAHASRRIARTCSLHGTMADDEIGSWGPAPYEGTAADDNLMVASAADLLPTMSKEDVVVRILWLDNDNSSRDRILVEMEFVHKSILASLLPWDDLQLRAGTEMRVIN
jgi:hypothetical protein